MGEIKDKVDEMTTINFSITKCPLKIYKRFVQFCKEETSDNYSFGLKLLLDGMEGNVKESLLFQQYLEIKGEVAQIKEIIGAKKETKKIKIKTLGSGGGKNG